jgi:hypothetical protein
VTSLEVEWNPLDTLETEFVRFSAPPLFLLLLALPRVNFRSSTSSDFLLPFLLILVKLERSKADRASVLPKLEASFTASLLSIPDTVNESG